MTKQIRGWKIVHKVNQSGIKGVLGVGQAISQVFCVGFKPFVQKSYKPANMALGPKMFVTIKKISKNQMKISVNENKFYIFLPTQKRKLLKFSF